MRKVLLFCLLLTGFSLAISAQTHEYKYEYDESGNRTKRLYIGLKSGLGESLVNSATGEINTDMLPKESISEYLNGNNIKLYPNPTRGEMVLEFIDSPDDKQLDVQLLDVSGKLILSKTIRSNFYLLDINNQPNGTYILKIRLDNSTKVIEIVKH